MTFDAKEAAEQCLKPGTRFGELAAGEQFRFPGWPAVLTKTRTGYTAEYGIHFRTSKSVAVIRACR